MWESFVLVRTPSSGNSTFYVIKALSEIRSKYCGAGDKETWSELQSWLIENNGRERWQTIAFGKGLLG